MRSIALLILACIGFAACGTDGVTIDEDPCMTLTLPLSGGPAAPVITDVGLEIQTSDIVIVATATDPQGSENLRDVLQSVGVYPDSECEGAPITLRDDLVASGVEETFGTVVDTSDNPALFAAIAAASFWPVEVDFMDLDGNRTAGRLRARIIR